MDKGCKNGVQDHDTWHYHTHTCNTQSIGLQKQNCSVTRNFATLLLSWMQAFLGKYWRWFVPAERHIWLEFDIVTRQKGQAFSKPDCRAFVSQDRHAKRFPRCHDHSWSCCKAYSLVCCIRMSGKTVQPDGDTKGHRLVMSNIHNTGSGWKQYLRSVC
jgi:hypothetical protein